jgi:hypothetical protein
MARRMTFNGIEIPVAVYREELFFLRPSISEALGYASSITLPEGAEVIEIGANTYVSLADLRRLLATARGERLGKGAEFLHRVAEVYEIDLDDNGTPIDDLTRDWLKAKAEAETAGQLLHEARIREAQCWDILSDRRRNWFPGVSDE